MTNQALVLKGLRVAKLDSFTDWQLFLKLFLFAIITSLVFFLACYIFQNSSQMSESAVLLDAEKRVAELKELNNNLEVNIVSAGSMEKIIPLINGMNFEKSNNVSFIKVSNDKVVVNKN
jgi:cell division protein FtsL